MANYNVAAQNTGASTAAQAAGAVRQLWQKGIDIHDQQADFFRQFEGGKNACIVRKNDARKGKGQTITFTNLSGFHYEPKHGDETFDGPDDYEKARFSSFDLKVDWIRYATSYNKRMEALMGMKNEIAKEFPDQLGLQAGRRKTESIQLMYIYSGDAATRYYAGGKQSVDALTSADVIDYDELEQAGHVLKPRGGMPAMLGRDASGNEVQKYVVVGTSDGLYSLKQDPTYRTNLQEGGIRSLANPLFAGGYAMTDGHVIKEFVATDHDGAGPVGSPQNPKMELGVAITGATTAIDIKGGGNATDADNTRINFSKHFPNYAYKFNESDTLTAGTDDFYVIIRNETGADAGKWGFYKVDTNDGNKLTMKDENGDSAGAGARLRAATSGKASTQIGDVVWDANKNTDAHPEGSTVYLANAKGQPIGHTIVMGKQSAFRGYGELVNFRSQDMDQGQFQTKVYVTTVFGQTPRFDRRSRARGFVTITHAMKLPGVSIVPTLA